MIKTSYFCGIHQEDTCKSSLYSNLTILTDFHSFTVNEGKLQNYTIFESSAKVQVCDSCQNWKMTITFNSVKFIKIILVNQVYILI